MKTNKNKIAAIDCEEAAKRFSDFIDNYLKGTAKDELVEHIAGCRHCFDRVEFEQLLKSKVASLGKVKPTEEKTANKQLQLILSKI